MVTFYLTFFILTFFLLNIYYNRMKSLIGCSVIAFNGKNTFNKYSIQFHPLYYMSDLNIF